jgi:hypothetical protein
MCYNVLKGGNMKIEIDVNIKRLRALNHFEDLANHIDQNICVFPTRWKSVAWVANRDILLSGLLSVQEFKGKKYYAIMNAQGYTLVNDKYVPTDDFFVTCVNREDFEARCPQFWED